MRYSVLLVSDRVSWAERAVENWNGLPALGEPIGWADTHDLGTSPAAFALDVSPPLDEKLVSLSNWSGKAWQHLCICWLSASRGAVDVADRLESWGYSVVLPMGPEGSRWRDLRSELHRIVESRTWLVPRVLETLGCYDQRVSAALSSALDMIPEGITVDHWIQDLDLRRRQDLAALFAAKGLPRPKIILDWLRLLRVVEYARYTSGRVTRDKLAYRFRYPSGDYLGKRAHQLTSAPLGDLIDRGVNHTLDLLVRSHHR